MMIAPTFRRLLVVTTAMGMVLPVWTAAAQDAPTGSAPPERVGQIASIDGTVSFNGAGTGGWAAATANYPVSAGDSLYTQAGSQAVLAVDETAITLVENTELQVTDLTGSSFSATESQGEVFLDVNELQPGESYTVQTPRGTVTISQDGKYDIAAGDETNPTIVTVFTGAAAVTDPGASVQVAEGQAAVLTGTDQTTAQLGEAQPDSFAQHELSLTQAPPPAYAPLAVREMTGSYELSQYGTWDQDPDYGAVWYPQVDADWAPYRDGYWADVPPWGYTWVDDEPWGFAPFHYGRWIERGGRWGWIAADPGNYGYQPIYAPAVVSFFGLGLAAGITAEALAGHSIGWVPLGPGEVFRPYYRADAQYDRRINAFNVRHLDGVDFRNGGALAPDHFVNWRAAMYAPVAALARGERIDRVGRPAGAQELAGARPIDGADFRGVPAVPAAREHPAPAPRPTAFGERHVLPPAVVSHEPPQIRPGGAGPESRPGSAGGGNRPAFGVNPGYRPPPLPPGGAYPSASRPPEPQVYRPGAGQGQVYPGTPPQRPLPQVERPSEPGAPQYRPAAPPRPDFPQVIGPQTPRPNMPQVYRPEVPSNRPPEPQEVRPPEPVFRPQAPEYHPPAPEFHPPAPQQEVRPPPEPRPVPPPPGQPQRPNKPPGF